MGITMLAIYKIKVFLAYYLAVLTFKTLDTFVSIKTGLLAVGTLLILRLTVPERITFLLLQHGQQSLSDLVCNFNIMLLSS
jgi:hypothetical protein